MRTLTASVDGPLATLSVRDSRLRVVERGVGRLDVEIDHGAHVVSALLPSGRVVQLVVGAGDLDQRVVLDGSPELPGVDGHDRLSATIELIEGPGSMAVGPEGRIAVSHSVARPGSLAVRIPDDPVPTIVRLPRSERYGATVSLRRISGQVQCTAITSDPRFSTAMAYQASGLPRQAAKLVDERGLARLREDSADEPVAAAHLAQLTRHVLDEEHLSWLVEQAQAAPDDADLAVAAADLAFRRGNDALCQELLGAADANRRPLFSATVFLAVHLTRRLVTAQRDEDDYRFGASDPRGRRGRGSAAPVRGGNRPDFALLLRGWTTLARRVDANNPTLTVRSTRHYSDSDVPSLEVDVPRTDTPAEQWIPGRTTQLRRSLEDLVARPDLPETLSVPVEQALGASDLDGVRRAVERLVEETTSTRAGVESSISRRALRDVIEDAAVAFPLMTAAAGRARRAARDTGMLADDSIEIVLRGFRRQLVSLPPYALLLTGAGSSVDIEVEPPMRSEDAYRTQLLVPVDVAFDQAPAERRWVPTGLGRLGGGPGSKLILPRNPTTRLSLRIIGSAIALEDVRDIPAAEFERSLVGLDGVGKALLIRARESA